MVMDNGISSDEVKILAALFVFSIIWIVFVVPFITINPLFTNLNPIEAYILFNLGFIALTVVTFGSVFAILKHKFDIKDTFINGIAVWVSFSWIFDMFQPPYFLDLQGNQVIPYASTGANASVDGMFAFIFNSILPGLKNYILPVLNISMLFVAVYFVVPLITAIIAAYILTDGELLRVLHLS